MKNPIRRKALSILLAFSMILSVFQFGVSASAAESTGVTAYYSNAGLFKDSNYTDGPIEMNTRDDYDFRASVTKIKFKDGTCVIIDSAFCSCTNLQSIDIPNTVTSIGNNAFYGCSSLTDIDIPDTVTSIKNDAFACCTCLASVKLPSVIHSISEEIFYKCLNLTNISIPDTVTSIGELAFWGCTSLRSIDMPDTVASIGNRAFSGTGLTSIKIPSGVHSIGEAVFNACPSLTDIDIPNTVTSIKKWAFEYCRSLTSVVLPAGGISVAFDAFNGCTSLNTITLSQNTNLDPIAFNDCFNIKNVYVIGKDVPTNFPHVANQFYFTNDGKSYRLTNYSGTGVGRIIPTSLYGEAVSPTITEDELAAKTQDVVAYTDGKKLYKDADGNCMIDTFDNYRGLITKIQFCPGNVTALADVLFKHCTGLESIAIPDTVTSIGYGTFEDCTMLTNVSIPENVTSIGINAFRSCHGLTQIKIPDRVTNIGEYAFNDCTALTQVVIPDKVTAISYGTFEGCTALAKIKIPNNVTSIGSNAFFDCSSLTGITLPNSVTTIGEAAFSGSSLANVILKGKISSINRSAFDEGKNISITFSVPNGTVSYYKNLLNTNVMGKAAAVIVASSHQSSSATPVLPFAATDSSNSVQVDLCGAAFPSSVTGISLSALPETSTGTPAGTPASEADSQGVAVYNLAVHDAVLNIIGSPSLYNIKLLNQDGNPILSFTGSVTVRIPVPAGIHGTPRVYRYEESTKSFTDMNAVVENGFLVFSTDHFRYYIIAGTGDSITLDTTSYQMPVGGSYQIGVKLTGKKNVFVKIHSTNNGIATAARLTNGNVQVNGTGVGTAWIRFDIFDDKNRLLADVFTRMDVKTGIRPRGDSTRQIGVYTVLDSTDSLTIDTTSYEMPIGGKYQIGAWLTGGKAVTVKYYSTNSKIAPVTKLANGNYQVTGSGVGTADIMFDVYDNKNHLLAHASTRVNVKIGIRPRGDATRQYGIF